jgi:hypothetical protein
MRWFRRSTMTVRKERKLCKKRRAKIALVLPAVLPVVGAIALCAVSACVLFVPGLVFAGPGQADGPGKTAATVVPSASAGGTTTTSPSAGQASTDSMPSASNGVRLVTFPWGSNQGEVGLAAPAEGLKRGPEALAVAPDGRVAVLDSVNHRLLTLDPSGTVSATIPLTLSEPRFLSVSGSRIYVLDVDRDHRVLALDWAGRIVGSLDVAAFDDPVTGLFAVDDGVCIETGHEDVELIAGSQFTSSDQAAVSSFMGTPTAAELTAQVGAGGQQGEVKACKKAVLRRVAGRPLARDLTRLGTASFKPGSSPEVKVSKAQKTGVGASLHRALTLKLPGWARVEHLISVDSAPSDTVVVGAHLLVPQRKHGAEARGRGATTATFGFQALGGPGAADDPTAEIVVGQYSGDGQLLRSLVLTTSPFAYVGDPYVVAPDGRIFQPVPGPGGYTILVHTFAEAAQVSALTTDGAAPPNETVPIPASVSEVKRP